MNPAGGAKSAEAQGGTTVRLVNLDVVKGLGVVAFVLWHAYSFFYVAREWSSPVGRGVGFVTGQFIYLSGIVFGWYYLPKMKCMELSGLVYMRLLRRFTKLFLYSFLANALLGVYMLHAGVGAALGGALVKIASLLWLDRWDVALQVLVTIGVGLLVNYLLGLLLIRHGRTAFLALWIALIIYALADVCSQEPYPYLWRFGVLSVLGMLAGNASWGGRWHASLFQWQWWAPLGALAFLAAAAASQKIYGYVLESVPLYALWVISVTSTLGPWCTWLSSKASKSAKSTRRCLAVLGAHSLFVYLLQILMFRATILIVRPGFLSSDLATITAGMVVAAVCLALAILVDNLRRYELVNRVYVFLF